MRLLRLLYMLPLRIRSLFRHDQVEQELDDELRDHLEQRIEADIARARATTAPAPPLFCELRRQPARVGYNLRR